MSTERDDGGAEPATGRPGATRTEWPRVIGNAASLYTVHAANFLIPLVSFPYLVRTMGISQFGRVSFVLGIAHLLAFIVEFAFNQTAAREVAARRGEPTTQLAPLAAAVFSIKAALMLVSVIALFAVVFAIPSLRKDVLLFVATMPILLGEVLLPTWLLHGLQRMGVISFASLGTRLVGLALLLVVVRSPEDLEWAAFLQAGPTAAAGIFVLFYLRFRLGIRALRPQMAEMRRLVTEGLGLFWGRLASNIYARSTLVVLGIFANSEQLGLYAIGHRIAGLVSSGVAPLAQALYPRLCENWLSGPRDFLKFHLRVMRWSGGVLLGAALLLGVTSAPLVTLLTGEPNRELSLLLWLFVPVIAVTGMNVMNSPFVLARKEYAQFSRVLWLGAALFAVLGPVFAMTLAHWGMTLTSLVVETVVLVGCIRAARRRWGSAAGGSPPA